jgi:CDP-diacylglycerol--glycerol-3-phosphate 3-phosphatidyltransferase
VSPSQVGQLDSETDNPGSDPQPRSEFAQRPAQLREDFWNWPNTVTMLRIAVVPVLLFIPTPWALTKGGSQFMAWAFILAALSDIVDGWLARRMDGAQITRMGKLLDPLADKLLVTTALIMLVSVGRVPTWATIMVVIIVGRELAVTGLRGMASSDGHVAGASWQGKLKSFVQNFSVGALLFHYPTLGLPAHQLGLTLLGVATALTLWSGYVYFADYFGWGKPRP